jgi:hypothetical protein
MEPWAVLAVAANIAAPAQWQNGKPGLASRFLLSERIVFRSLACLRHAPYELLSWFVG